MAGGLQNPGNVGALLRTAEAAGATGAYLAARHRRPALLEGAARLHGQRVPPAPRRRAGAIDEALARLRRRGVTVLAAVAEGGERYDGVDLTGPVAFVLGQEAGGLAADTAARADRRITIPMGGRAESLNVAVAAGVLLFEAARQRAGAGRSGPR